MSLLCIHFMYFVQRLNGTYLCGMPTLLQLMAGGHLISDLHIFISI
jgi:hypothetical protein